MQLPMIVALKLVGFPDENHKQIKNWADHGVALLSGINTPEDFAEHTAEALELLTWVREHYNKTLKDFNAGKKTQNFCTTLIEATKRDKDDVRGTISDEEAVSFIF
jgi:cytochrome P450